MKVIPPIIISTEGSFTRSSTATYYNNSGVLSTAAVNVPRINYDPSDLTKPAAALYEVAATNLLTYSEQFDNAIWSSSLGILSITANGVTAPDGTTNADTLTENTNNSQHYWYRTYTLAASTIYTWSCYAKPKGIRNIILQKNNGGANVDKAFNLTTGVAYVSDTGYFDLGNSYTIQYVGNGWYRVSITFTNYTNIGCGIGLVIGSGSTSTYIGDGTSGLYVWGAQLETGSVATSYIPTTAAAVTRSADVISSVGVSQQVVYNSLAEPDATMAVASNAGSSTLTGEIAWVSGTTYAVGDLRILSNTHRVYERLVAGAGTVAPILDTTNWMDVGPTNKWALFNTSRSTGTISTSNVVIILKPNVRFTAIALVGMAIESASITVHATVGGSFVPVFNTNTVMNVRVSNTWSDYFFKAFYNKPSRVFFNIPPNIDNTVTIAFKVNPTRKDPLSGVQVGGEMGGIVLGNYVDIGTIQNGVQVEALNFSVIDRDIYGNSLLVPRRSVPKTSQTLFTSKSNVSKLLKLRDSLNAVPAVWIGIDDDTDDFFEALLIYGVYKEFTFNMEYPDHTTINVQLEEL